LNLRCTAFVEKATWGGIWACLVLAIGGAMA
jgi:hypothetical protein